MNNTGSLLIYTICYSLIFTITWISKINNSNRLFNSNGLLAKKKGTLITLHLAGILWLGLVPIFFFKPSFKELIYNNQLPTIAWQLSLLFALILIAFTGFTASRKVFLKYEHITAVSSGFFGFYFLLRLLFLSAYELFFRGLLLFDLVKWIGIMLAILVTTGLTVLIHVFTNKKEMWGCVPFGIMTSLCCIAFNAVWPAIAVHMVLSMAFELPLANQFLSQLKIIK